MLSDAQQLHTILTDRFDLDGPFPHDATLSDIDMDSVAVVELVETLNEDHGCTIGDDDVTKATTLDTVAALATEGQA